MRTTALMTRGGHRAESGPQQIVKLCARMGLLAFHIQHVRKCRCGELIFLNKSFRDYPDVFVLFNAGRLGMIEWKGEASTGKRKAESCLKPKQKERVAELRALGFDTLVTGEYQEVVDWISARKSTAVGDARPGRGNNIHTGQGEREAQNAE